MGALALTTAVLAVCAPAATLTALAAYPPPSSPPPRPDVSASLTPTQLRAGAPLEVAGWVRSAGAGVAGGLLALQADPYPYRGFATIARVASAADGSFAFAGIRPDRNTRLRVTLEGPFAAASGVLRVIVEPKSAIHAYRLGPGQTRLSVKVRHPFRGRSGSVAAWWYVAVRGSRAYRLAAVTSTQELAPGVTYATTTIDPPSRRFSYRVCLNPPWEGAIGPPDSHRGCVEHDFTARGPVRGAVEYEGEGRGIPLPAFPSSGAIASAARFLAARAGRTSFAVVDSRGRLMGARVHEHFQTASVVKVMMLVAYLQMLDGNHRALRESDGSLLYPMIHSSDNGAASQVLAIVGGAALARVAREAGMSDYAPGVGWWAFTQTSAADQARFLDVLERLIPAQFYAYARGLLSGIEPSQSWGIPPVTRPRGWQVFFKTGALPSEGLFNEVARLERPGLTFTIAVFTTGDPSMGYGEETIAGVASALLGHAPWG